MVSNYTGISGSRIALLAAAELKNKGKAVIVVSTSRVAERLADDLAFFVPGAEIIVLPEDEKSLVVYEARNRENQICRLRGISALVKKLSKDDGGIYKKPVAIVAPASAALRPTISRDRYILNTTDITVGMRIEPDELKRRLVAGGYQHSIVTEGAGEFSGRGGILDVFSPSFANPIRIEFFDDEIDSIRFYNSETQRSIENIQSVTIGPAAEYIPTADELALAIESIDDGMLKEVFEQKSDVQIYADYLELFDVETHFLWDMMDEGIRIVCDPARVMESIPEYQSKEDFAKIYEGDCSIYTPFPEKVQGLNRLDRIYNVKSRQVAAFNGQIDLFAREMASMLKSGFHITIVCSSQDRIDSIKEYLEIADVIGNISYRIGSLSGGLVFDDEKICYITEEDIFPRMRKKPARRRKPSSEEISFSDLHNGDYVVHEIHGIGRFEGIKPMTADGVTRDYLVIRYAGSDVLYIPTEQLDIIQKYIGSGGSAPNLSRLSGGSWRRTRERARKAVMEIAEDLVKLYAERESCGGYAFPEDGAWQSEFEADFPYTETYDQLRAIEEIKEDMQQPIPMDRLLCGDVGYGKTEVAARAIFKCIADGKQAAILAPTTLLVNQHYHSLKERFANFPFEIDELSRFRTPAEQADVIRGLADGSIDLVIGTHRLLSNDITFKDFGLLVIDEEQRFGVQHKEKIKKLRSNVDVLTLSATPIPRTLNMSLTGVKNISTIAEPPSDRYPVQTFVTPYDEKLLKSVIEKEMARGGQVFVVKNRITGINTIAATIERLVPEARVATGHGRMSEEALENTMLDFVEGNTDVLVATTIIENGIDIPNANTIVIMNADKLGLAQLYQLRGRVGRSSRIAYAYLMYQPQKVLTELAAQRLTAIREFTEFGSGFKIAMRDLEMRGAGNILGEAQSGHIEGIGYELYCKEIDAAVRRLRGEQVPETRAEITIDIKTQASIPASYITDESLRLQAYKKIACINSQDDADELYDEFVDRYGDVPDETLNLIRVAEIRSHAEAVGVELIAQRGDRINLKFAETNNVDAYMLILAKEEVGDTLTIMSGVRPSLSLYTGRILPMTKLVALMRALRNAHESSQEIQNQV
ncbi:MAG: transcription-repair coupling factor [Clostridiales bacterium]|nr:transcription-repair coupling factor [Candidatus Crickella caballi]